MTITRVVDTSEVKSSDKKLEDFEAHQNPFNFYILVVSILKGCLKYHVACLRGQSVLI